MHKASSCTARCKLGTKDKAGLTRLAHKGRADQVPSVPRQEAQAPPGEGVEQAQAQQAQCWPADR